MLVLLPQEIEALIEADTTRASRLAAVTFPARWPDDVEARQGPAWHLRHLRADVAHRAWRIRVLVEQATDVVVGSVNMKGPPDTRGDVEIGWGVSSQALARKLGLARTRELRRELPLWVRRVRSC